MNFARTVPKEAILPPAARYLFLSNAMMFGHFSANFIGWWMVEKLSTLIIPKYELIPSMCAISVTFIATAVVFAVASILQYERPIRKTLAKIFQGQDPDPDLLEIARKRLLNEPLFVIGVTILIWVSAGLVFSYVVQTNDSVRFLAPGVMIRCSVTGLITMTITFFWVEHIIQHRLAPIFFPDGGLYATKGTFPTPLAVRFLALSVAGCIIPMCAIHLTILGSAKVVANGILPPVEALGKLQTIVLFETVAFIFMGSVLTMFVCVNFTRPMKQIIQALRGIGRGDVNQRVRVFSNDEIGYAGDIINKMTEGLKERNLMRQSLNLAMEVQQNLLPKNDPIVPGLDIAGKSLYCDETGGDYFDYLVDDENGPAGLGVVVGDVSGHGISSALLMASARASLRLRARLCDDPAAIISDVNRELSRDIEDSGQFVTLFYLSIDAEARSVKWVRAGHEPAIVYDPVQDRFSELKGSGVALGLDPDHRYMTNESDSLKKGGLVVLATDGLWEARNAKNDMFGKNRLLETIRKNADRSSSEIVEETLAALSRFQDRCDPEDDVTMVVLKVPA